MKKGLSSLRSQLERKRCLYFEGGGGFRIFFLFLWADKFLLHLSQLHDKTTSFEKSCPWCLRGKKRPRCKISEAHKILKTNPLLEIAAHLKTQVQTLKLRASLAYRQFKQNFITQRGVEISNKLPESIIKAKLCKLVQDGNQSIFSKYIYQTVQQVTWFFFSFLFRGEQGIDWPVFT